MTEPNGRNGKFDWRTIILSVAIVIGGGLVQWGFTQATLGEHARRLEEIQARIQLIEKRQEENLLSRPEYDKRHEDLLQQLREVRDEMRELQRRVH